MPKRRFYESKDTYQSILFPDEEADKQNEFVDVHSEDEELVLSGENDNSGSEVDIPKDGSDDNDEDMPESISFLSSRQNAMAQMKTALKQIEREKQRKKEKRKQLDDQFKEQKRKKLEELAKKRLPEDFLNDLPDDTHSKKKLKNKQSKEQNISTTQVDIVDEDEESFADTEEEIDNTSDFIPLESDRLGGVEVHTLKEYHKTTLSSLERAKAFKHSQLYGGRIRRETTRSKFAKIGKRRARFK